MDQQTEFKYNCVNCNYKCNEKSKWEKHINTVKHTTGQKKVRSDYEGPYKCTICIDYETPNKTMYKQHILNYHSSKEKREEGFKYYCKLCDYGSFSKDLLEKHNLTVKHKKHEYNLK
jgi:hypothetical protein